MKKHLLLTAIFSFLLSFLSFSQVIEWQNTIGGSDQDQLRSICKTGDGGYLLGGQSNSSISGDKSENSRGGYDYWILKLDALGQIQWQKTIGGVYDDYLMSVIQTPRGGYILGGNSSSPASGEKTDSCFGNMDYWILYLSSAGDILWQKTFGGTETESLTSISLTSDGGFILGGMSNSNISGNKTDNVCNNSFDYYIIKLDSTGNVDWQNSIGGASDEWLLSVRQNENGDYLCGGSSASTTSCDKTEPTMGNDDYWVVKLDNSGNILWQNTIGGNSADELSSMFVTQGNEIICGGYSYSNISGDKSDSTCNNSGDWWIIKLDSLSNIIWQSTVGGDDTEYLYSLSVADDSVFYAGGKSYSDSSCQKMQNSKGVDDYWIAKFDLNGNMIWETTIGGSGFDRFFSIQSTSDGGCIGGGWSNSSISGDKNEDCLGGWDFWIVKIVEDFNLMTGKLFIDTNLNGNQDPGENSLNNKVVTLANNNNFTFSDFDGNFKLIVADSGSQTINPTTFNYYSVFPSFHSIYFPSLNLIDSLNDFAYQPAGVFNDLCVTLTPLGPFRSGFNQSYMITYENVGTTTLNPTVIFFPDNDVSFVSAAPVASVVTTDSLIWNFGLLAPFQSGNILVTVNVNTGVPIGTLINSGTHIEPLAGDANTICNQSYWEVFTTGSIDPNDILVDQDTLLSTQFPNPPFLDYLIRFQNTGNDTAFTVKILNLIDTTKLELSSFEFVASSHPVNLSWIPWERNMQFMFNNILLPDSNVNEPQSHGFVRYRIKPKSNLIAGDSITNNAAIYFDFNDPFLTNTAYTHIVLPTSLPEVTSSDNLLLYPNPANTTLTIETRMLPALGSKLIVSDVAGRTLLSKTLDVNSTRHQIDIATFSAGIYFVQVEAGDGFARGRFVKE